ncbi:MAG: tRNA (adenosine(37)-N6)-threonylcarbamoyltransferase complex ATPase subunit type 1 TsaE [Patescibacteria group bacterium]
MAKIRQKITKSALQTQDFGLRLAKRIPKGTILALSGDLGGGKTCFTQGLGKGLGIKQPILSPSFVITKVFPVNRKGYRNLYHLDLYRLRKAQIDKQSLMEIINDQNSISAIEWAEKIKDWLPQSRTIYLQFDYLDQERRSLKMKAFSKPLDKILKLAYN